MCDELFQSKLDLRRHKKYACGSVGAALYAGLGDELKVKGLGSGGGDGQAHECKDCERMFPNKYRCLAHPRPLLSPCHLPPPLSQEQVRTAGQPALGHREP